MDGFIEQILEDENTALSYDVTCLNTRIAVAAAIEPLPARLFQLQILIAIDRLL